jgi:hypothetical protein
MGKAFDPYEHWLGIPPPEQPPNYYRLLGIGPGESDLALIGRAYQLRMDHVQLCDDGTYPEAAMRLREHLTGARHVLLDPELKGRYDTTLKLQSAPEPALGSGPPFAGPIPSALPPAIRGTSSAAKAWLSWLISVALAFLVAVPILMFLIGRIPSGAPRPPAENGDAATPAGQDDRPAIPG